MKQFYMFCPSIFAVLCFMSPVWRDFKRDFKVPLYLVCRALLDLLALLVRMVCLACLDPPDLLDLVDVLERWDLL